MKDRHTLFLRNYREEYSTTNLEVASSINAYNQALANILHRFITDASTLSLLKLPDSKL